MRIYHAAETIKGGIATVMSQLAVAQNEAVDADNVHFLVPECQAQELRGAEPNQISVFERDGREILSFFHFMVVFTRDILNFRPDVVHLHSSFAGVMGRLALLPMLPFYRPVVIYTPHAWAFLMSAPEWQKKIFTAIEYALLPLTTAVVCNSRYEFDAAVKRGLPTHKMHLILHGVATPAPVSKPSPYKSGPINLLFVGRFDKQKGFDKVIEAMRRLNGKNFHLTVVGEPVHGKGMPPALPNVTYNGWLTPNELAPYFAYGDVLVMPSRWESFGLVAAEASSYGMPVVASDCCSLPELVVDGVSGKLFPIDDVDALVKALVETSAEQWHEMGIAAKQHQQTYFTLEKMVQQMRDLYVSQMKK